MKAREMVNGEIEIMAGLNRVLEEETLSEEDLLTLAKQGGIDLGANHKPRLNYLVTLMILQRPKPIQYGKGKGGTRFFQRDAFECLQFVQEQNQFALNEIRDIVIERRNDLVKKACRELNIENDIPNRSSLVKAARFEVNTKCLFSYDLIKADVLSLKLGVLHKLLTDAQGEIAALKSFYQNLEGVLCGDCGPEVDRYIKGKEEQEKKLLDILREDLESGKDLLGNIE